jgi:hypothetical protein
MYDDEWRFAHIGVISLSGLLWKPVWKKDSGGPVQQNLLVSNSKSSSARSILQGW